MYVPGLAVTGPSFCVPLVWRCTVDPRFCCVISFVCVCLYLCMYVCMLCVYVCVCVGMCVYVWVCVGMCGYVWVCVGMCSSTGILWLNGGPGCSSLDGVFKEVGPFHINNDLSLRLNPYGWDSVGSTVFLDQPVGTGMSYVTNASGFAQSQADVNRAFTAFLRQFLKLFPTYQTRPLYIAGESYAGHYIPCIATYLLQQGVTVNLAGVAIGNGTPRQSRHAPSIRSRGLRDHVGIHALVVRCVFVSLCWQVGRIQ
jgi:hypothetical protein